MKLLEARNLSVRAGPEWACAGLDFSVSAGERWGILGVNGSGKTSLLHTLCGLRAPDRGEVLLKGVPLSQLKRREAAKIAGILFQDVQDVFPSTVLETVLAGRHPHLDPWRGETGRDFEIARAALREAGLSGMEARLSSTLSGGERRRLAIAALLAQDPELYLLDEPTNHLDIRHQVGMLDCLASRAAQPGKALVMILHDPGLAQRYCDRLLLLFEGGRTLCGRCEDILNEENLSALYRFPMVSIDTPLGRLFAPALRPRRPPA